jgi:glycine cleavage system aminomethyltransferase T
MGRFGLPERAPALPQYALTNNALALEPGQAQYTILANENGSGHDAYLYR